MTHPKPFWFILAILTLGFSPVWSQSGPRPGAASQNAARKVSFLLVGGAKAAPETFILGARGANIPVKLNSTAKSNPVTYDGANPLIIYTPDAKAKGGKIPIATVPLPPGAGRILILLAPGSSQNGVDTLRAAVVDDDPATMPPGSIRFLNYSGKSVSAQVGKEVITLDKGPSKAYPAARSAEPTEVVVQIATQEADGFEKVYSAKLMIKQEERQTYILLPTEKSNGRGLKVVMSRDVVPLHPQPK